MKNQKNRDNFENVWMPAIDKWVAEREAREQEEENYRILNEGAYYDIDCEIIE